MRVLFLYPYLPAPDLGHGSARLVSRLLQDVKDFAEVTLVCAYRPGEREHVDAVRPLCHRLFAVERPFASDMRRTRRASERAATGIRLVSSRLPLPVIKLRRSPIRKAVREAVAAARPEIAHVELSVMAQYVEVLPPGLPSVLVDHEAGGPPGEEPARWRAYVRDTYTRFDRVLTLSEEDRDDLLRVAPALPIGVRPPAMRLRDDLERRPEPDRLLFFGSQEHAPNRDALAWLADEVFGRIRRLRPQLRLLVAGSAPDDALARRVAAAGIELLGYVPDLEAELARAAAVISPVRRGRGVRMKNLEALALGVPLVTTPLGARGLAVEDGVHCRIAETAHDLAAATAAMLADPDAAEAMARRGRAHARERHHPRVQTEILRATWESLLARPGG